MAKTVTPGYKVVYPNREKPASRLTRLAVAVTLLASAAVLLLVTVGGWSKLQGFKGVSLVWSLAYVVMAFYIFARWSRGLLPIASALAMLLLVVAVVAGLGVTGTSWFDRNHFGFGAPETIFGGRGLNPSLLGFLTVLLVPVQALLIFFAMVGFIQAWNVETEVPDDDLSRRGGTSATPHRGAPATT